MSSIRTKRIVKKKATPRSKTLSKKTSIHAYTKQELIELLGQISKLVDEQQLTADCSQADNVIEKIDNLFNKTKRIDCSSLYLTIEFNDDNFEAQKTFDEYNYASYGDVIVNVEGKQLEAQVVDVN